MVQLQGCLGQLKQGMHLTFRKAHSMTSCACMLIS